MHKKRQTVHDMAVGSTLRTPGGRYVRVCQRERDLDRVSGTTEVCDRSRKDEFHRLREENLDWKNSAIGVCIPYGDWDVREGKDSEVLVTATCVGRIDVCCRDLHGSGPIPHAIPMKSM